MRLFIIAGAVKYCAGDRGLQANSVAHDSVTVVCYTGQLCNPAHASKNIVSGDTLTTGDSSTARLSYSPIPRSPGSTSSSDEPGGEEEDSPKRVSSSSNRAEETHYTSSSSHSSGIKRRKVQYSTKIEEVIPRRSYSDGHQAVDDKGSTSESSRERSRSQSLSKTTDRSESGMRGKLRRPAHEGARSIDEITSDISRSRKIRESHTSRSRSSHSRHSSSSSSSRSSHSSSRSFTGSSKPSRAPSEEGKIANTFDPKQIAQIPNNVANCLGADCVKSKMMKKVGKTLAAAVAGGLATAGGIYAYNKLYNNEEEVQT